MSRSSSLAIVASILLMPCLATAQGLHPVGRRQLPLRTVGTGTVPLPTTFYYPATKTGDGAPLLVKSGGWPVLVFLHGFDKLGRDYVEIGTHWAERGYVVCLHDSAPKDLALQVRDAQAMPAALARENADTASFFHRQLRVQELVLLGHSTGASNVAHVLAANPGYVAGVAYGPFRGFDLQYTKAACAKVTVPMLVLGGQGETITPWKPHVQGFFDELQSSTPLRALCVLNSEADHYNIVAWVLRNGPHDRSVFEETQAKVRAFVDYQLTGEARHLEPLLGHEGRSQGRLAVSEHRCEAPLLWRTGDEQIGGASRFQHLAGPGAATWLFSFGSSQVATPWGMLRVHPARLGVLAIRNVGPSGYESLLLPLPRSPQLVGLEFCFQTLAAGSAGQRLSPAAFLRFTR